METINITEAELEQLLKRAAAAGVREYVRQEKKARKQDKYHDTFSLMRCYRDAVFHVEHAVSEGSQIEAAGDDQRAEYLQSIRGTKYKTVIMLEHINAALEEIERRREAAGRGIEYEAFRLYFMQGETYQDIAEKLNTGTSTPRRWITAIINELGVLLWGIDDSTKIKA